MTEPGYTLQWWRGTTRRERDVLRLLYAGLTTVQTAEQLGLTKQRIGQLTRSLRDAGILELLGNKWIVLRRQYVNYIEGEGDDRDGEAA